MRNRNVLYHVTLESEGQDEPGREHGERRTEICGVGIKLQPIPQIGGCHCHRPSVRRAAHHAFTALTMWTNPAPLVWRGIWQNVGFGLETASQQISVNCPQQNADVRYFFYSRRAWQLIARMPESAGAGVRQLVMQAVQLR